MAQEHRSQQDGGIQTLPISLQIAGNPILIQTQNGRIGFRDLQGVP